MWEVIEFVIPAPPSHDVDDGVVVVPQCHNHVSTIHLEITFLKGKEVQVDQASIAFYDIVTIARWKGWGTCVLSAARLRVKSEAQILINA